MQRRVRIAIAWLIGMFLSLITQPTFGTGTAADSTTGEGIVDRYAARFGDSVYFCGNDGIYRMGLDGTNESPVRRALVIPLRIVGDWMYFLEDDPDYKPVGEELQHQFVHCFRVGRMKTNGMNREILLRTVDFVTAVENGWIYYGVHRQMGLYRVRTDGTGVARIINDKVYDFEIQLCKGWLYYSNESDGGKLYKIKNDGTSRVKLTDDGCINLIADDWIYFVNHADQSRIYRIRLDGTGRTRLTSDNGSCIGIQDGWLYYLTSPNPNRVSYDLSKIELNSGRKASLVDNNSIDTAEYYAGLIYYADTTGNVYFMDTNGQKRTKLYATGQQGITDSALCFAGDWLFVYDQGEEEDIYPTLICRMKTDGTRQQTYTSPPAIDNMWNPIPMVTASSTLVEPGNAHTPSLAVDNDKATAWVEASQGDGVNEWLRLDYRSPQWISGILIINGYAKSKQSYHNNNRVKKMRLEFSDGQSLEVDLLDDTLDYQEIEFQQEIRSTYIKITILEVYESLKYNDTCISEVHVSIYRF